MITLDSAVAARLAELALANITREYPHKLDHVMANDADALPPRRLHPAFHGSYDWHSCVHMHWLLARLRRRFPDLPNRSAVDALFDLHFAPDAIAAELAYLARPDSGSFERPYGWAWLLKLAAELHGAAGADSARWSRALQPLADAFAVRYLDFLPRTHYPFRHGLHPNSAFALAFALDYARITNDDRLRDRVRGEGARMVCNGSRCAGRLGALGRRLPFADAGRGRADAAHSRSPRRSPNGSRDFYRASSIARRPRCSRRSR